MTALATVAKAYFPAQSVIVDSLFKKHLCLRLVRFEDFRTGISRTDLSAPIPPLVQGDVHGVERRRASLFAAFK